MTRPESCYGTVTSQKKTSGPRGSFWFNFRFARYTERSRDPHAINSGLPGESEIISTLRRNYLARFSKTSFATDRAENALGQPA
jgi:hypothetical protein